MKDYTPEEKATFLLCRHAETVANTQNLFRGRTDYALDENGFRQAAALAEALAKLPVTAVYSGPLARAMDTARPTAGAMGLQVVALEAFQNIRLGAWEGRAKEEVRKAEPELWETWVSRPEDLAMSGMERLSEVRARALGGMADIARRHAGQTAMVVTHRSVLKEIVAGILGLQRGYFWKFYFGNASLSIVEFVPDRGFVIRLLNDCRHVAQACAELY